MNNEVTSCAPLAEIASHTREAICDYALDPIVCYHIYMLSQPLIWNKRYVGSKVGGSEKSQNIRSSLFGHRIRGFPGSASRVGGDGIDSG